MAKRATARDVAELAGVSRTTVSFVLNNVPGMRISEETRQRVIASAQQLNYHPDASARNMARGRTYTIGFVLRQGPEEAFADHFLPQVLNGLSQATAAQGYHTLLKPIPLDDKSDACTVLIRERHVDGIVVSGPRLDDAELLRLHAEGTPIVLLGKLPDTGIAWVDVDNVHSSRIATAHLLERGHRRVALITNAPPLYTASVDRTAGYRQALEDAGIPFDPALVRHGNFTPESGLTAMEELLALNPPPTAVFVASDTVALGALQALRLHGLKAPRDIALVGFDDIPLAGFVDPPLTTVRLPAYGLGWAAADLLIRLIGEEEPGPGPQITLETELIVRESAGY